MVRKINLAEQFARFADHWNPRIAGELNGQHVKLVKFQGSFVWHSHASEDELFLVVKGEFTMEFHPDQGDVETLLIREGEFAIVPRGVPHRPCAATEVQVLLFEPASTLNTGNVQNERTRAALETI